MGCRDVFGGVCRVFGSSEQTETRSAAARHCRKQAKRLIFKDVQDFRHRGFKGARRVLQIVVPLFQFADEFGGVRAI